jgi:hypothetical protein
MNCERELLANITSTQLIDLMCEQSTEILRMLKVWFLNILLKYLNIILRTYYSYYIIYTSFLKFIFNI